jgi:hypothetical protein
MAVRSQHQDTADKEIRRLLACVKYGHASFSSIRSPSSSIVTLSRRSVVRQNDSETLLHQRHRQDGHLYVLSLTNLRPFIQSIASCSW